MNHFSVWFSVCLTTKTEHDIGILGEVFFLLFHLEFWEELKIRFLYDCDQTPTDCVVVTLILMATSGMTLLLSRYTCMHSYTYTRRTWRVSMLIRVLVCRSLEFARAVILILIHIIIDLTHCQCESFRSSSHMYRLIIGSD